MRMRTPKIPKNSSVGRFEETHDICILLYYFIFNLLMQLIVYIHKFSNRRIFWNCGCSHPHVNVLSIVSSVSFMSCLFKFVGSVNMIFIMDSSTMDPNEYHISSILIHLWNILLKCSQFFTHEGFKDIANLMSMSFNCR